MDEMFGFISIMVVGFGLYGFYAYFQMKKGGPINEALLLGRSYAEYKCKDKEQFVKKSLPAVLIFACASVIYGVIDLIHCYVQPLGILDVIGLIGFLAVLVWYLVYTSKLKKQYF